ncbi:helix-turn-helix domain-containing protein [Geodermatophilus normandii]|uniref:AraC family transcriptional regulator n=1 Tax=Geodermatophilus normandii TaxID=1137989 RepID=A0A6P0GB53_9ACTN|nr:AraC family transcriptional regulator [Geodermatophilus normandii]
MGGYREERGARTGAVLWRVSAGPDHRVLPDGAVDLLWWRERLVVAGPDTRAVLVDAEPGEEVAGLRLPPGAVPEVLGVPASELVDTRTDLGGLVGHRVADPGRPPADVGDLLERVLVGLWQRADPDRAALRLAAAVDRRLAAGMPVAAVAAGLGLPLRTLHRVALRAFGHAPQTLARIRRVQRALDLARRGTPLARVAVDAGYTDQAHLTREVTRFAGLPPRRLLRS